MQITLTPEPKQDLAYQALWNPEVNFVFFGGGAGGGKTWFICESRLVNAIRYPGYRSFIGRKELKRLMQSTYITWLKVCAQHHLEQGKHWKLDGKYNYIELWNGSRIDLLDVDFQPSDPMFERFGSLEYTDGALEEAGEIKFQAFDVLKSRVGRHLNRELGINPTMVCTMNPTKDWVYRVVYKPSREGTLPKNYRFIQALYSDNRYTAKEYGKQLSEIQDKATKERLMFGNWEYDSDPAALMEYDAITDLFNNTLPDSKDKYLTCDVARYGDDKTVIMLWQGLTVHRIITLKHQGTDMVAAKIKELAASEQIRYSNIAVDEDGIGGGVIDQLKGIKGFLAGSRPLREENYQNLKAQCSYQLGKKVNAREIAIRTEDEQVKQLLIEELEQIKAKDLDKDGKLAIIPKDKVKEIIGRSPDYADCMVFRMYFLFRAKPKITVLDLDDE